MGHPGHLSINHPSTGMRPLLQLLYPLFPTPKSRSSLAVAVPRASCSCPAPPVPSTQPSVLPGVPCTHWLGVATGRAQLGGSSVPLHTGHFLYCRQSSQPPCLRVCPALPPAPSCSIPGQCRASAPQRVGFPPMLGVQCWFQHSPDHPELPMATLTPPDLHCPGSWCYLGMFPVTTSLCQGHPPV